MVSNVIFFESSKELEEITGLSHNELWENGFNLDDMDWGFVSDRKWHNYYSGYTWLNDNPGKTYEDWEELDDSIKEELYNNNNDLITGYSSFLLSRMENYCVGYCEVNYNGKWYYTLHHS